MRRWLRRPLGQIIDPFTVDIDGVGGPVPPDNRVFPIARSTNNRYLVTGNGHPFFLIAGSPQAMTVNMPATDQQVAADAGVWFSTRRAQGFNGAWINFLCGAGDGGRANKSTFDGITPFTATLGGGEYDLSTPRATYWSRMDQFVQVGTKYGFLLLFGPAETISNLAMLEANGVTACMNYGQFLGNRYAGYPNILWHHGNDYFTWDDPGFPHDPYVKGVAQGIRNSGHPGLHTLNLDFPMGSLAEPNWQPPVLDVNDIYTYDPCYGALRSEYNRSTFLPTIMGEASYEHEHNAGATEGTPLEIRRQAYWTVTNGASGMIYGEQHEWQVSAGWETFLAAPNSLGATHLTHLREFTDSIGWWTLVPDQANTFLTAGTGTSGTFSYNTAAKNPAGTVGVVAVTFAQNVTVNCALMAGPVTARWFDPTNGNYIPAGSGLIGSQVFTHPGNNSAGDPDRVLLLEA